MEMVATINLMQPTQRRKDHLYSLFLLFYLFLQSFLVLRCLVSQFSISLLGWLLQRSPALCSSWQRCYWCNFSQPNALRSTSGRIQWRSTAGQKRWAFCFIYQNFVPAFTLQKLVLHSKKLHFSRHAAVAQCLLF